ncbi:unnamed protein product [Callosobruchus maculatus]|uniref:Uncharacterized protein n=1 Tax=Callosobruchus maculatus TaxID=64391 RepID=A0A653CIZ1_CALMS|nr:unnamed protein product [Callosobruchus maculatus]
MSRDYSPRDRSMSISPDPYKKDSPSDHRHRSRSNSRSPAYKKHNGRRSPTHHSNKSPITSHHKCAVKDFQDRVSMRHRFPNPRRCMTIFKLWINCVGNEILQHLNPIYSSTEQIIGSSRSGSGFLNYMPVSRGSQLNPRA